jgi:ankyrin repeat protein
LGEAPNFYDESYYGWNEKHIEILKAYRVEEPKQDNFMLLVQKGDELLDANESLIYLPNAEQIVEEGGNHSFEGIDRHLRVISDFLGMSIVRRKLRYLPKNVNIETLTYIQEEHKDKTLLELLQHWPRHMRQESPEYYYLLDEFLEKTPDLDMHTDDEDKRTALHIACGEGNIRAVERLLLAGANPNVEDARGVKPLEYLVNYAWRAQTECYLGIYYLVKSGADLDNLGEDDESQTALGWACIYGGNTLAVVSFLLESGADVNKKNHQGLSPLMLAAKSDRTDLVMILLFFKADINAKDNNGMTALDYARKYDRQEVITFLEKQLI